MKIQVAVFFGGRSVEHEISIISAMQAIDALDKSKYDAIPVYIAKDGALYTGDDFSKIESYKNLPKLFDSGKQVSLARLGGKVMLNPISKKMFGGEKPIPIDVALPVVHGTFAEDGSLQGYLEILGLPYCGCDVLSSAVCMDKPTAKAIMRAADIPVLPDLCFDASEYSQDMQGVLTRLETKFPYPMIVKPVNLGSSIGISRVDNRAKLESALNLAFSFSNKVMVEPAVVYLREINVSVLGNYESAKVSVCEEPVSNEDILTYKDKYQSGAKSKTSGQGMSSAQRKIPADLSRKQISEITTHAINVFKALKCSGVIRIDFLMDTYNTTFYVNEVNTIPGSLAFYLWEHTNLPFRDLLDKLIDLAFERSRTRSNLTFTYDTNILSVTDWKGSKK